MRTVTLTPDVQRALGRAFAGCGRLDPDPEPFLAAVFSTIGLLPAEVLCTMLQFRSSPTAPGVLLLHGMPVDVDLPPTPTSEKAVRKDTCVSEASILLVALLLGEPVGYADEKDGMLVQNVFPIEAERQSPSNESSEIDLGFHTELAYSRRTPDRLLHLISPDFLLLLGLRAAPRADAVTRLVEARDICAALSERAGATLRQPLFQLRAPYSFTRGMAERPWSGPVPLLHGSEAAPTLAFDLACGVRALTSEATDALNELRQVVAQPELQLSVRLAAGDLLVVHNRKCAHARSQFRAAFDGSDRWLQRVYVRRGLDGVEPSNGPSFRIL
jgi:L-asparagine oxygenase